MTQEDLADKTEVSVRTIQRIENGEVDPRAYTLQMIAQALDVDYNLFVEIEPEDEKEIRQANTKNWLGLLYFSCIIPLLFPTIVIWNSKKDKIKGMSEHYRAAIRFQMKVLIVILICIWIYWKVNQPIPLIGVLLMNALYSIFSAIKAMSDKPERQISAYNSENKNVKTK